MMHRHARRWLPLLWCLAILGLLPFNLLAQTPDAAARAASASDISLQGAGSYTPTNGFKVADSEYGDLNIRVFTYIRYLNQLHLDDQYVNAFGRTQTVQQRQDFQINKAQVYFFGWIMSQRLRYVTYIWTSNVSQGLGAQVVIAGNLSYQFSPRLTVGAGINGLPGVRSTEGTFPYWLGVDTRMIADEFFRPSYTTGLFARGTLAKGITYNAMLGNNLSQLGVDAGQLGNDLNAVSATMAWMPTTGEFGRNSGFGDFDEHTDRMATRVAVHFTRSDEDRQGQPNTDAFENVQIRLSDGNTIFAPDLFAPNSQVDNATYHMLAIDGGVKYRGYSIEGGFYRRWVNNLRGRGLESLTFDSLDDRGFILEGSAMISPQQVQAYAGVSKVFGQYGNPWDVRAGVNWFPWKNQVVRWNFELIQLRRSPVGALSLPYNVGANGPVFHSNFMVWF